MNIILQITYLEKKIEKSSTFGKKLSIENTYF